MPSLPQFADILSAAEQLDGKSIMTPVLSSPEINRLAGCEVLIKCENLQHIGAFKFRGAYNAISRLSVEQKERGVIAYSSGNHAQAVAYVCHLLGVPATIVMPDNAPKRKLEGTRRFNPKIVLYNPDTETRESVAEALNPDGALTLIPPFNHPDILTGQGTSALELHQAHPDLKAILVPCGGAGLLSGSALATKGVNRNCQVIGVEPELADDATQSFQSGQIVSIDYPNTIADGTRTLSVGDITFALMQQHVDDMWLVSESQIMEAVKLLFNELKQVVEPSGALGLAALLSKAADKVFAPTDKVGVIISGGNIDPETLCNIMRHEST